MAECGEFVCKLTEYGNYEPVGELVRCEDCKSYDPENEECKRFLCYDGRFFPDGYCSYGVRKYEKD